MTSSSLLTSGEHTDCEALADLSSPLPLPPPPSLVTAVGGVDVKARGVLAAAVEGVEAISVSALEGKQALATNLSTVVLSR